MGKWNGLVIGESWNEKEHDKVIENVMGHKGPLLNLTKDLLKSILEGIKEGGEPSSNDSYYIAGNSAWSDILELLPNLIQEFRQTWNNDSSKRKPVVLVLDYDLQVIAWEDCICLSLG